MSDITDVTATATEVNYTDGVTSNIQTQLDSKVGATHTGDVDITGELLVDSYNETFKKVSSVSAVTGFLLSSASYDSKSLSVSSLKKHHLLEYALIMTELSCILLGTLEMILISTVYLALHTMFLQELTDSVTFSVASRSLHFQWVLLGTMTELNLFVLEYTGCSLSIQL